MVVFTVISTHHTRGASLRGCLQDKATAKHSGGMCLFVEEGSGDVDERALRIKLNILISFMMMKYHQSQHRAGHMT